MAKPTQAPPAGQQWVKKTGKDEYTLKDIPGGVQLSPDALKPDMSKPELPEGVFQNKSSGAYTDKYGNVGQLVDGKFVEDKPVDTAAPMSTEEQAKGLIDYEYGQSAELGQELFGKDNPMKGTFAEVIEDFKAKQADQKDYFTTTQQQQEQLDLSETLKAKKAAQSSAESVTASLSQGREGVTSSTRPKMIQQYQGAIMEDINNMITRFEMAQNARAQALKDFEEAQKSGRADLIEQRRAQLVGAEQELKQTNTELLNAQSRAADLALKINEQDFTQKMTSLENFQGMVNSGVTFDTDGLIAMSDQLNLPVASLNAYYKGMETIRKDKSLDQQEKQFEIDLLNQQLQREMNGVITKEAQNIEFYKKLVREGKFANKDEQYAYARTLGIEEYNDPFVQAELALRKAELDYRKSQTAVNYQNVVESQAELARLNGNNAGNYDFVPGNVNVADVKGKAGSNNILTYTNMYAGSSANKEGPDFSAPVGTPINAHISGTVVGVISDQSWGQGGWGNQIRIEDANGNIHQFSHLNPGSVNWQVGDKITPGQLLAEVGSTGLVMSGSGKKYSAAEAEAGSGAHLDYTVYKPDGSKYSLQEATNFAFGDSIAMPNTDVQNWGYSILDGRANISNVPDELRTETMAFVNEQLKEGYQSDYPVLTETQLDLVNQISDDFNNDKQVSDMLDVKTGFDSVKTIYGGGGTQDATGFDDIAAINAFQRMIDPGATVREGDVDLLQTSVPWLQRVSPSFKWAQFTKGDKLPEDVRESLLDVAAEIYNTKAQGFNDSVGDKYKNRAEAANVPFNLIGQEFVTYGGEEVVDFDTAWDDSFLGTTASDVNIWDSL